MVVVSGFQLTVSYQEPLQLKSSSSSCVHIFPRAISKHRKVWSARASRYWRLYYTAGCCPRANFGLPN